MPIPTKPAAVGFIASEPTLAPTSDGTPRFYARVGLHQSIQDTSGRWHDIEPYFTDLVMFGASADRAYAMFQKGDNFIAPGRMRTYPQTVDGQQIEREQFRAEAIGHNNNLTRYTVDRTPRQRDAAGHDAPGRDAAQQDTPSAEQDAPLADAEPVSADPVAQVLAQREQQVAPEPAVAAASGSAVHEAVAR